ncbi:uncharacterized protein Z520_02967 [Fonsecaea multimorphosa CBS 102226]|uniref:Uncharacterized protein n=1 Tax=Fonsecaea multimorphosa CBS 102226 TaxID=1442371 RepID=A0A0D2KDT1_9EURO|nr:uncharacterized protein Z520_02967 [Fonsecaea multimorphosa CBS 102226]KIY01415.1 hypothetical protein Z520_02967 [Fonsecaea multimorphosa CBS 102226]OAL28433.1 hypothetical protein AYO22_02887 [Fonsecaea multimorphosa]
MALVASPPLPSVDVIMDDSPEHEMAQVRVEIEKLTQQRKVLAASLLASTKAQSRLSNSSPALNAPSNDNSPLQLQDLQLHSQTNAHRLAFGVTSFPFHDPSPELQSSNPLLGIRIDICNRNGFFDSPYYMFCVRARDTGDELRIHRHTIPALVPLEQYEKQYLPISSLDDEGYGGSDDSGLSINERGTTTKQDLHGLVARVRYDLVCWRLRKDVTEWLRKELDIPEPSAQRPRSFKNQAGGTKEEADNKGGDTEMRSTEDDSDYESDDSNSERGSEEDEEDEEEEMTGKFNVQSLASLEVDARQLRIVWFDDRVGRIKISDDGKVQKAVVIGLDGNRVKDVERILMGDGDGSVSLYDLVGRLEEVYNRSLRTEDRERGEQGGEKARMTRRP